MNSIQSDIVAQLTNLVIRPHRDIYGLDRLGTKKLLIRSKISHQYLHANRKDLTLTVSHKQANNNENIRDQKNSYKIQVSIYEVEKGPTQITQSNIITQKAHKRVNTKQSDKNAGNGSILQKKQNQKIQQSLQKSKVAIFLHSNSGSRIQSLEYVKYLLQYHFTVIIFDYSGSGISEGQYVTMSLNQTRDLDAVVNYAKEKYNTQNVCLWGRSMGAVTAIQYAIKMQKDTVIGMVLDSPFCNFQRLLKQLAYQKTGLPQFLYSPILSKIREKIIEKTKKDLFEINLTKDLQKLQNVSCLFITSKNDKLVPPQHTEQLYKKHTGVKDIIYLQGQHNQPRSNDLKQKCSFFLHNCFQNYKPISQTRGVRMSNKKKQSSPQKNTLNEKTIGTKVRKSSIKQQIDSINLAQNKKNAKRQVLDQYFDESTSHIYGEVNQMMENRSFSPDQIAQTKNNNFQNTQLLKKSLCQTPNPIIKQKKFNVTQNFTIDKNEQAHYEELNNINGSARLIKRDVMIQTDTKPQQIITSAQQNIFLKTPNEKISLSQFKKSQIVNPKKQTKGHKKQIQNPRSQLKASLTHNEKFYLSKPSNKILKSNGLQKLKIDLNKHMNNLHSQSSSDRAHYNQQYIIPNKSGQYVNTSVQFGRKIDRVGCKQSVYPLSQRIIEFGPYTSQHQKHQPFYQQPLTYSYQFSDNRAPMPNQSNINLQYGNPINFANSLQIPRKQQIRQDQNIKNSLSGGKKIKQPSKRKLAEK